jgi:threonyl-tRNA synthetase
MPDLHTLTTDINQAIEEFKRQFSTSLKWMKDLQLDNEVALRFVKEYYEKNKDFAIELAKLAKKPILIELWNERYFYFVTKFEFNIIDSMNKASALSTVQIDVENAERFNITYTDEKGQKKYPYILHTSISGSIDRCVYALLEREAIKMKKGQKPILPLWLSPTQIRFIPVNNNFNSNCEYYINELNKISEYRIIRADIDDREESVSRKIRDAEKEWIPIIIVIGEKEKETTKFNPRFRTEDLGDNNKLYSLKEIYELITDKTKGFPEEPIPLCVFISKRPKFK